MKVRNLAKLVRLEGERRQYIAMKNRLLHGRARAALARQPGGARRFTAPPVSAEVQR